MTSIAFDRDPRRSSYPGLAPFAAEDTAAFFSREQETDWLVARLQPPLPREPDQFVALVGPPSSGKSPLLYAGLLPHLARQSEHWVLLPPLLLPSTEAPWVR